VLLKVRAPEAETVNIMDIGDLFFIGAASATGGPRRKLSPQENIAYGVGGVLFPLLTFLIVLFGELWRHAVIAMVGLPAVFSVISYYLARRLDTGTGFTWKVTLGCAVSSFVTGAIAWLMALFFSFFQSF
jgi:hypothetical protein